MPAPHKPTEFEELIIQEDDTFQTAWNNLTQLSIMFWRMMAYKYHADTDDFADDYGAMIGEVLCPDPAVDFEGEGIRPSDFRNLIMGPTSGFCEKFVKFATQLSNLLYNWVAFEYTAEGTFTEEYMALLCAAECDDANRENKLNYEDFIKWDVVVNCVDLIGVDPLDPYPGNGMYVDLHGTQDATHTTSSPGGIRNKTAFNIVSGQSYELKLDLAGYAYTFQSGNVRIRILRSDNVTAILDEEEIIAPGAVPFATYTYTFTAAVTDTCKIQIEEINPPFHYMNVGTKLDNVILTNTTSGTILFQDDFDADGIVSGDAGAVETFDPADALAAIPIASLTPCEKFKKVTVDFPTAVYNAVKFEFNASGVGFTDDFVVLICRWIQEVGEGEITIPAPTGVSATDGSFDNMVTVSWSAVTPATGTITNYQIYRSPETVTDPASATLIGTTPGNILSYQDTSAVVGTVYRYWVRATQDGKVSQWSNNDTGYAAEEITVPGLPAIDNLTATQGFYTGTDGFIRLMWTMPAGINRVDHRIDIYRNTTADFPSATLIQEDTEIVKYDHPSADDIGKIYQNDGETLGISNVTECIYWHEPPSGSTKYYFWVVLKQLNRFNEALVAISEESNQAVGWVQIGTGDTNPTDRAEVSVDGTIITVPVGKTKMRVVMIGAGGSASDAINTNQAGAAGAGGDVLLAQFTVTPGDAWTWSMPQARSSTGLFVNQAPTDGPDSSIDYEGRASHLEGPGTEELQAAGGLSATWFVLGANEGGHPAPANSGEETHISNIVPIESTIKRGAGGEGSGSYGSRGGYAWGFNRPGSGSSSIVNAGSVPAAKYSGSSSKLDGSFSGGNNGVPLMLVSFSD